MVRDSTDFVRRKDLINLVEITPEEHKKLNECHRQPFRVTRVHFTENPNQPKTIT